MAKIQRDILKGWIVVIIDDEPDSLEVATRILSFHGAKTYTALNGVDGLQRVAQVNPRLIISDLSMPVMDGWELLTHLQQNSMTSGIPVIALTAHAMVGDRDKVIAAGFHSYLTKPLTPATFMQDLIERLKAVPQFAGEFTE